ncbi:MAG: hypothetical protein FJ134_03705 [Deltaproteobacteria bacterium]|nr:hypothetical protein [Deltaproteobacteria bacterium]
MKKYAWLIILLITLLTGCAPGYYYYPPRGHPVDRYGGIDPYLYDYDPTMRHWYTPPYFDPHHP